MGLKGFWVDLNELAKHQYLRFDEKYWSINKNFTVYNFILLKDIFTLVNGNSYTEYYTEERTSIPYIRVGNLTYKFEIDDKDMIYLSESVELTEDKILKADDLILATVGATIGKINLARKFKGGTFSNNTLVLRLKDKENHNPYFYEKLFQTNLFQKFIYGIASQKSQPNLQTYDLKNLKIPIISKATQDQIISLIKPIEKQIRKQKTTLKDPLSIINKIFAEKFRFNLVNFEKLKKEKFFEIEFAKLNNPLIRSTVIQNKKSSNFLKSFLFKNSFFLKDILLEPIKRGVQPEYAEDGIKVIKTLNIQEGKVVFDEVQFVSEKFLESNKNKAAVNKYDLLLSSTGVGRGKFALYEDDETCFADSHISIIRINKEKINPFFLNYYCQSFLGVEQLKYIEMHIKGTPEIYEKQLKYFQIPNIPLSKQEEIVNEIKSELDKQEKIKNEINRKRDNIDKIIENLLSKNK